MPSPSTCWRSRLLRSLAGWGLAARLPLGVQTVRVPLSPADAFVRWLGERARLFADKGWPRYSADGARNYLSFGLNYHMVELTAAVGLAQLPKLDRLTSARNWASGKESRPSPSLISSIAIDCSLPAAATRRIRAAATAAPRRSR